MEFEPVIGLEIHAQLATRSKLFCACPTEFGQAPNANTCPVCLGLPGVLPVVNRRAVELAIRLGLATHCTIRLDSQFARKNYFYPDLPKAYQISQYDRPLCERGWVEIAVAGEPRRIGITRIHLEEDAGKLVHEGRDPTASYVDLNRAGVPLVEIVSEPELRSPEEAKAYMEKMHALVTYLDVGRGDMEKGNLRADANISLRPRGSDRLGTRTETKNLNSFRFVQQALAYEIERQRAELLAGRPIVQETRLWDALGKTTYSMRSKEEAHDYRYFPEPDLAVLRLEPALIERIRAELPELPDAKAVRFQRDYGLSAYDAAVLVADRATAEFFDATVGHGADPKRAANWITVELAARCNEDRASIADLRFGPERLAEMIAMIGRGEISSRQAKTVFDHLYATGRAPAEIVREQGLSQLSDAAALEGLVAKVLAEHPGQVEQYRAGKTKVLGFFVGQIMKATGGQANPALLNDLLRRKLA
ncbi:MAG: Asp-tRNA(Asn)/Glu-tRNA(Gln) amidotransferase subunit GatB [Candidatus Lambdaproteobacteria bacterium]|nr:Asp-tRNA(Asn)/Glu-tRNA(Gln) amidotransferase subunit GatB [Candidatus Lambdaproteobacteria bacterium]